MISSLALAAAGLVGAQAANAGGYTPAVVEPPVTVAPVVETQVGNWQGAYVGATLGYATGEKDRIGLTENGQLIDPEIGDTKIRGVNGGVHVGYRWQRDRWVFGPELSFEGGSVDDSFTTASGVKVESKLKSKAALKLKTGYEVQPNMLVYGIAGVANGKYEYKYGDYNDDYTANGYVFGIGVERQINERMSVIGEIERNQFDKEKVELVPGITTTASPSYTNVKVGLNFKF
ncbi:porin family protein [Paracoccus suum]|uniref:Porin family protein n=2 Tax=Paracoccus suum TaxID=2259340 RepID=A0A344PNZ4_9RHOB|nr:porin family protein [Paracoccus suum]